MDWGLVIQEDRLVLSVKRNFYHLYCLKVCVFGKIISKRKANILKVLQTQLCVVVAVLDHIEEAAGSPVENVK